MDVREMIKTELEKRGYEGLYEPDGECACETDDLFPCGQCFGEIGNCKPGWKVPCPEECGEGHVWHIMEIPPNTLSGQRLRLSHEWDKLVAAFRKELRRMLKWL